MLKNKWDNILNNAKINDDDRAWLEAIFDRMVKAEKKAGDQGWALEAHYQTQRDNFHGDGQW